MRGAQGGVLGRLGKLAQRRLSPEEQNIAVRGRGEPIARAQAFEPGCEIRQEQTGSVQAVALPHAQDAVAHRLQVQSP
jgi:hypothetical protein